MPKLGRNSSLFLRTNMRVYTAGLANFRETQDALLAKGIKPPLLESFFYLKEKKLRYLVPKFTEDFFLDSGAFSAWSKGKQINLDSYIEFIKNNDFLLKAYATLDDIKDPKKTEENTEYMREKGLDPIPVFHWGEPYEILDKLIAKEKYIALGGMVPITTKDLLPWLDDCFVRICDSEGNPKLKVHGFGLTTVSLMRRYPWFSVDSTSVIMSAAMGRILLPNGTDIGLGQKDIVSEIDRRFLEQKGYNVEELRNHYRPRQLFNFQTYRELENEINLNPVRFVNKQTALC
jgi:hypothetical protein